MPNAIAIDKSTTSDPSNTEGKTCVLGKFISEADGWRIVTASKSWAGTPYSLVGANSAKGIGGDCSGITYKSYTEAGFPYPYQSTGLFAEFAKKTNRFRRIDPKAVALQAGDLLLWDGHMAIYAPFPEGDQRRNTGVVKKGKPMANNMYTAFNSHRNVPYGPYNIETFRPDSPTIYRYLIVPGLEVCNK